MSKLNPKIRRLRLKNLPHMTAATFGAEVNSDASQEDRERGEAKIKALDEYLHAFVETPDGKCICCGEVQGVTQNDPIGMINALMGNGGKFVYGIQHGEGRCSGCGWPARANHYIGDWCRVKRIMQYHPDSLLLPEDKQKEVAHV